MMHAFTRRLGLTGGRQILLWSFIYFVVGARAAAQSTLRIIHIGESMPAVALSHPYDTADMNQQDLLHSTIMASRVLRQPPAAQPAALYSTFGASISEEGTASYAGSLGGPAPTAIVSGVFPSAPEREYELLGPTPPDFDSTHPTAMTEIDARAAGIVLPTSECPYSPTQSGTSTICGIDCSHGRAPCDATWDNARRIPWSTFGPGEYVGPARREHAFQYFLRVNDELEIVFLRTRNMTSQPYVIGVGDRLFIESLTDRSLQREISVQPDGAIWLPVIGQVRAAGYTVAQLRTQLEKLYLQYQRMPTITLTPLDVNPQIQDLLDSVTARFGANGQSRPVRVTPEGTIQLPGLGSVYVQGLTLDELRRELEARYQAIYGPVLTINPLLTQKAPSLVFIGGEVKAPGRYTLEGPTTVMQAIALAGGWNVGGNTKQIIVFRRDENWCLKATKIDLKEPLYGLDPCPVNDVWLRDNDLVLVPKSPILAADDVINLYFTRGVYSVFPMIFSYNFGQGTVLVP